VVLLEPDLGAARVTTACSSIVGGWTTTRDAEHAFHDRHLAQSRAGFACTAFLGEGTEVAVLVSHQVADLPEDARAFVFPGHARLVGVVAVGDLVATSGVEVVQGLGGLHPSGGDLIDTQQFVRPRVRNGRLVLTVRPGADGILVPFEQPNPTPCCADPGSTVR
jgi:hypothetical protein